MKSLIACVLISLTLAGCGVGTPLGRSIGPAPLAAAAAKKQSADRPAVELKKLETSRNGYVISYLYTVSAGGIVVAYRFDDTPLIDDDTSPARIEVKSVTVGGQTIGLNDVKAVEAAVAVLRTGVDQVAKADQRMVRVAIAALTYDL